MERSNKKVKTDSGNEVFKEIGVDGTDLSKEVGAVLQEVSGRNHNSVTSESLKDKLLKGTETLGMDEQLTENEDEEDGSSSEESSSDSNLEVPFDPCPKLSFTQQEFDEWCRPWRLTLIVKLIGRMVGVNFMTNKLEKLWKRNGNGEMQVIDLEHRYYAVSFTNQEDYLYAYEEGPWLIADHYLIVQRWRPNFNTRDSEEVSKVAVWIRVPSLPLEFYNAHCLRRVGNLVGKTLKIDPTTSITSRGKSVIAGVNKGLNNNGTRYDILYGLEDPSMSYEGDGGRNTSYDSGPNVVEGRNVINATRIVQEPQQGVMRPNRSVNTNKEKLDTRPVIAGRNKGGLVIRDKSGFGPNMQSRPSSSRAGLHYMSTTNSTVGPSIKEKPSAFMNPVFIANTSGDIRLKNRNMEPKCVNDMMDTGDPHDRGPMEKLTQIPLPNETTRSFPGLVGDLKRKFKVDFVALLETHQEGENARHIMDKLGFERREYVEASGHSGGIWCLWNEVGFKIQVVSKHNQLVHFMIDDNRGYWFLSIVYGSPQYGRRRELWDVINSIGSSTQEPWCIVGDFNAFLASHEKEVMEVNGFVDLGFKGTGCTWRQGNVAIRLDRVIDNVTWRRKFPEASVIHLPPLKSDHSPILVNLSDVSDNDERVERPFRFLTAWLTHQDFGNVVRNAWGNDAKWGTAFFHTTTMIRRKRNKIEALKNDRGEWTYDQEVLCGHDRLMTNEVRKKRLLTDCDTCTRCLEEKEDILHTLRDCRKVRPIWMRLVNPREWSSFFVEDRMNWLERNLSGNMGRNTDCWPVLFAITCWTMWKMRNEEVFQDTGQSSVDPVFYILHLTNISKKAYMQKQQQLSTRTRVERVVKWCKPEEGWVKVNSDGASKSNRHGAACSVVIRNDAGGFLAGFMRNLGDCEAVCAELWGLKCGLEVGL
ncbi:hypothetical protein G2W53_039637 [Senna tora]|uniref:DUF4283 domain-containing protein n=1 Tax=Senna tora TaxID=362788 RepID=A0A834SQB5_9FABA|nr:hypothetical protein G2W53_039637 [Senna tora]